MSTSSAAVVEVVDSEHLAARAAALIAATLARAILENGSAVLVPSAGRTPTQTYRVLRDTYADTVNWRRVHIVQMDEYREMAPSHPLSLAHYLSAELVTPLRVGGFSHFNDETGAPMRPLDIYEAAIGPIDLAVHGIGRNGHIGFNEPGSPEDSRCRSVRLARSTLRANFPSVADRQRYREGVTLGLATLRAARNSLVLAIGSEKAAALRRACCSPPSSRSPASRLRGCRNVVFLADHAAARRMDVMPRPPLSARNAPNPAVIELTTSPV